jgi:hypothetical protein
MRVLAQNSEDANSGFFAVDQGPIYQDQKWWLSPQFDGSYEIINVKSNRRILARIEKYGMIRFAAEKAIGPPQADETWWMINQEWDETAHLLLDIDAERQASKRLVATVTALENKSATLYQQLQTSVVANDNLSHEIATWQREASTLASRLQEEHAVRIKQAEVAEAREKQHSSLRWDVERERVAKEELFTKVRALEAHSQLKVFGFRLDSDMTLSITALIVSLVVGFCVVFKHHICTWLELRRKRKQVSFLEKELYSEIGDMCQVGDTNCHTCSDFGFSIFNAEINQESARVIKIRCPGVKHSNVEVELIFNGCEVLIRRPASLGVEGTLWKKRFQFRPSDGLFEFREEQMQLEDGFLQLVFRACAFHNRRVLFPRHFSLSDTDGDACWEYAAGGETDVDDIEAWWHDNGSLTPVSRNRVAYKVHSSPDVDTESTASTARVLV